MDARVFSYKGNPPKQQSRELQSRDFQLKTYLYKGNSHKQKSRDLESRDFENTPLPGQKH